METLELMTFQNYLKETYQGKKVFLTGHTGFKGAWLLSLLNLLGAEVKGYALSPLHEECLYNHVEGNSICTSIIGDIRDKSSLEKQILNFQPDFIFHLAAQPLVRLSYEIPSETFEVNAIGTAHVLDAIRNLKKPCVVVCITTDKVYENNEWHYPYRESDRLGGYDPYSASKAAAEMVICSYRSSFFNPKNYNEHLKSIASARAGNVIGGGDWAKDRIIPDSIKALQLNEPIIIRNPNAVRPWQHVLEPISGYLLLGAKMNENPILFADAWNFGPYLEDNLTVEEVVEITIKTWGSGSYKISKLQEQYHEAKLLKLDISKTVNELKWKPRYDAVIAIKKTINWYKESQTNLKHFTIEQIKEFIN